MTVSEIERMELVGKLTGAIGRGATETLMACVLPDGRDQLATKADLEVLGAQMKAEVEILRAQMEVLRGEMEVLRGQMELLEAKMELLETQMDALGRELRAEHAETRSFVEAKLARQARLHYGTLSAFLMSIWGMFLAQNIMM